MPEQFRSPIFGLTRHPTVIETVAIDNLVEDCPVAVFQVLNKALNKRGLCLTIDVLEELRAQQAQ